MNYPQFFIDTAPTLPTFYDELGLTLEGPPADGPSTAARDGDDRATPDFSDLDFGDSLTLMDNAYAPFDGPSLYSYEPLFSRLSWDSDNIFERGYSDLGSTSSNPDIPDVTSGHSASQPVQSTERRFALDISNTEERVPDPEPVPQLLCSTPSSVSPSEVETPTTSSYTEEGTTISTTSSSPAGKSPRQRGGAASSTAHKAKTSVEPSGTRRVKEREESNPTAGIPCRYRNCNTGPFYDNETMKRHVREIHLGVRHECPGCGAVLSRKNSVTRHLNATPTGSRCRAEGLQHGWEEDQNGRLKLSVRSRTGRSTR